MLVYCIKNKINDKEYVGFTKPVSTVNNKLRQGLVDFVLKGIKIQRIYE